MKLIQNSKFTIQNFLTPIYLFFLSTIIACSSTTEISKGELSGVVNLEGLEDHSGIIVALYDLAYLDTTITRINNQYPQIGVKINQHTEFDHRLQSPVKYTETDVDGSFEITKIPTGNYSIVAMKAGWGFKYLYEIEIEKGDNQLSTLTPNPSPRGRGSVPLEKGESKGVYSSVISTPFDKLRTGSMEKSHNSQLTTHNSKLENRSVISTPFDKLRTGSMEKSHNSQLTTHNSKLENRSVISTPFDKLRTGSMEKSNLQLTTNNSTLENRSVISTNMEKSHMPQRSDADITLYEEVHISGNISNNIIIASDHHLIIDDHTVFIPNSSSLTIHPGAVIRINPGKDLTIHGNLLAQGEENNMFWITSNHGFDALTPNPSPRGRGNVPLWKGEEKGVYLSRNFDLDLYNSFELSEICNIENDLISWGKFSFGNSINVNINNIHFINNEIRNSLSGIIIEGDDWRINNNLLSNLSENRAINFNNSQDIVIEENIINDCYIGIEFNNTINTIINNNYICHGQKGILIYNMCDSILVSHNQIEQFSAYCIEVYFYSYPVIEHNNINSAYGILNTEYTGCSSIPEIHNNNLNCTNIAIKNYGNCQVYDIPAQNNYFYTTDEQLISGQLIWDYEDAPPEMQANGLGHILFEPILNSIEINSGIK